MCVDFQQALSSPRAGLNRLQSVFWITAITVVPVRGAEPGQNEFAPVGAICCPRAAGV